MLTKRDFDDDIEPAQVRAARALLDWSQGRLAELAGVSPRTVSNFETGEREAIRATREAMKRALEGGGVRFALGGVVRTRHLRGHDGR